MSPIKLNFSGYYKYVSWTNLSDNGFSSFTLNLKPDGSVYGSGRDNIGPFNMSGALIGDNLRFIKQYTTSNNTWKYIGKRVAPKGNVYQFVGTWGYPQKNKAEGEFVFSAVDQSSSVEPYEPVEGQWTGNYFYSSNTQAHPMNLALTLDTSAHFNPNGPFSIVGLGSDDVGVFDIKGTVGKVNHDGSGGQVSFIKSYSGLKWKYQGRYDGKGSIGGTWGHVSGGGTSGSFQMRQQTNLTIALAAPILKQVSHNISCPPTLASAVQAASKNNTGVTSSHVLSLLNSFTS